jgi:hypothetical protein
MSELHIPDVAEPLLGFRVWRFHEDDYSLWSVVQGDYKKIDKKRALLSGSTPNGYWPKTGILEAKCMGGNDHDVPDSKCSCGIYSTYDVAVIAQYIHDGPVLGLVQGYGTVIPGKPDDETLGGFRAQNVKMVALFEISEDFTIPHRQLHRLGREYDIPVIVPWSDVASEYLSAVRAGTLADLDVNHKK